MKALKLAKSKTNGMSNESYSSPEPTFKTSFEDLRRPDGRQNLRQHFSGAFPESQPRPSPESTGTYDMGLRQRLERSSSSLTVDQSPVGKSPSSSSVDSAELKRLSTVRESNSAAIDIEQAISLLQELKKTASPQDLVALHKALLPTRDSAMLSPGLPPSAQDEYSPASASSFVRHRSMMPPGIATRGGAFGDPLRTQEEAQTSGKRKKTKPKVEANPGHNIAALDLADETALPRAATPTADETMHMGAYRPGTLRITNGVASPEPSIRLGRIRHRDVDEPKAPDNFRTGPSTPEGRKAELYRSENDDIYSSPLHGKMRLTDRRDLLEEDSRTRSPDDSQPRFTTRPRGPSFSNIPVPLDKDPSQPRMYKPTRSRDPSKSPDHSRKSSASLHSRKQSLSQLPLPIEDVTARHQMPIDRQISSQSLQVVSRQSYEPLRAEIDDGKVSPLAIDTQQMPNMPRFAQRWSHRLSRISQASHENGSEYQLPMSPHEDDVALRNLAKRLSAHSNLTTRETREAALARLNGEQEHRQSEQMVDIPSMGTNGTPLPSPATRGDKSDWPNVQKIDSGYGSDVSAQTMQRTMDTGAEQNNCQVGTVKATTRGVIQSHNTAAYDDDRESPYSVDHLLNVPFMFSGSDKPSPPSARGSQKHWSLLGLTKNKKRRSTSMTTPGSDGPRPSGVKPDNSPNNASPKIDSVENSPANQKGTRSKKKLQKPMPESVRKELRSQMNKKEESGSTDSSGIPYVPDTMASNIASRPPTKQSNDELSSFAPKELNADVPGEVSGESVPVEISATTHQQTPSRSRSKSRGDRRPRSSAGDADGEHASVQRSWSLKRMRSRSRKRSGTVTPKASAADFSAASGDNTPAGNHTQSQLDRNSRGDATQNPVISAPFDQSTNLYRRTIAVPNGLQQQSQSQFDNRPNFSRSKSGGLAGMEDGMASELARLKSRDMAVQNNEKIFEKSYSATPKSQSAKSSNDQSYSSTSSRALNWSSVSGHKSTSPLISTEDAGLSDRPCSPYAESIPPLPEMPTNVGAKVSRLEGMVSQRANPRLGSTANVGGDTEGSGYSTESIAEAVKRAVDARRTQGALDMQGIDSTRPSGPRKSKSKKQLRQSRSRELQESPSEDPKINGLDEDVIASEQNPNPGSVPASGAVNWEQHAKLWRERRKSIGETLGRPVPDEIASSEKTRPQSSRSPAIVVPPHIIPSEPRLDARSTFHNRTYSASQHADAYRELIGENKENRPAKEDVDRVESTASFTTATSHVDERQGNQYDARINSTYSAKSYQTATSQIERARSPGGRVRTPSGNFHPYTPANALVAEQSRSESLAKLNGTTNSRSTSPPVPPPHKSSTALESLYDRYGGGFQYGYERGVGVGGSAGFRTPKDVSHRKGAHLSETAGLDFSDIPIFLQRVQK